MEASGLKATYSLRTIPRMSRNESPAPVSWDANISQAVVSNEKRPHPLNARMRTYVGKGKRKTPSTEDGDLGRGRPCVPSGHGDGRHADGADRRPPGCESRGAFHDAVPRMNIVPPLDTSHPGFPPPAQFDLLAAFCHTFSNLRSTGRSHKSWRTPRSARSTPPPTPRSSAAKSPTSISCAPSRS